MEAVGRRRVRSGKEYDYLFPFPTGSDVVIKKSADVSDTVRFIQEQVPKTIWQTEQFAKFIEGRTLEETCSRIWHFLYDHIPYKKDEDGIEQIRSPRRSWYDRNKPNGGIDCDCYSVFISSALLALKIPHKYRITKYPKMPPEEPRWQHIYIVVPKDGKLDYDLNDPEDYIVMDCVKNGYNKEEPFLEYKDYNANMRLDYLDGLDGEELYDIPESVDVQDIASIYDEEELGKIGQWLKKAAKNVGTAVKKVGDAAGKVIRTINKVANPATILLRNGFLLAMKTNIMNVGKRLRYAYLSDAQAQKIGMNMAALAKLRKVVEKAETIYWQAGGKKENLKKAILTGKGNKDGKVPLSGLFGIDDEYMDMDEYNIIHGLYGLGDLGAAQVALAPAMAAVTAVAAALKEIKDLFKPGTKESGEFASEVDAEAPATIPAEVVDPNFSEEAIMATTYQPSAVPQANQQTMMRVAPKTDSTVTTTNSTNVPANTQQDTPAGPAGDPSKEEGFFQKAGKWVKENPGKAALIGVGVGIGIYMIAKKKNSQASLSGIPKKKRKAANASKPKKDKKKSKPVKRVRVIKI